MEVRRYGTAGPDVVVLHGGPGAPGSAEDLARALSARCRAHEPVQRAHDVPAHVEDLHDVVKELASPVLVGWSWGAMLALAYAAAHPVRGICLVGCGTFDREARAELQRRRKERLGGAVPRTMAEWAFAVARTDDYDLVEPAPPLEIDEQAAEATWNDAVRLQEAGVHPAAFASIRCPVLMLHGDHDPHPGAMIRDGLRRHLPQLEYVEIPRCGHAPWRERHGRDVFFKRVFDWVDTIAGS